MFLINRIEMLAHPFWCVGSSWSLQVAGPPVVVASQSHFANIPPFPSEGEVVFFTTCHTLPSFGEH